MFYCADYIYIDFGGYITYFDGDDIFEKRVDSQGEFDDEYYIKKRVDSQGEFDDWGQGGQGEIACDLMRLRERASRGPKSAMERL